MIGTGVAAVICRHEFVFILLNLFTEESLLFYKLLINKLLDNYNNTGKVDWFLPDIPCIVYAWWKKSIIHPSACKHIIYTPCPPIHPTLSHCLPKRQITKPPAFPPAHLTHHAPSTALLYSTHPGEEVPINLAVGP